MHLNVSGATESFIVPKSTLCSVKETAVESMFSGRFAVPEVDGKKFVNRNPKQFLKVLDYLRNE